MYIKQKAVRVYNKNSAARTPCGAAVITARNVTPR